MPTFPEIETTLNELLASACSKLMSDPVRVSHYAGLFDRSTETGFYSRPDGPQGIGEAPTWAPNPAYMNSLEELWHPVEAFLDQNDLALEKPLRDLFFLSREYKDREHDHRRIFHGQLIAKAEGTPVTYFMLNIPHSHKEFGYITSPKIQIADSL